MRTEHRGRRLQTHLPVHALARQPASPRARLPSRARRADWHGVCQRSSASTLWENCKSAKHYGNRSSERLNCPWPWRRVLRIVRRAGLDAGSAKTFTRQWITAQRLTGRGVAGAVAAGDGRQEDADYQTRKLELGSDGDGLDAATSSAAELAGRLCVAWHGREQQQRTRCYSRASQASVGRAHRKAATGWERRDSNAAVNISNGPPRYGCRGAMLAHGPLSSARPSRVGRWRSRCIEACIEARGRAVTGWPGSALAVP